MASMDDVNSRLYLKPVASNHLGPSVQCIGKGASCWSTLTYNFEQPKRELLSGLGNNKSSSDLSRSKLFVIRGLSPVICFKFSSFKAVKESLEFISPSHLHPSCLWLILLFSRSQSLGHYASNIFWPPRSTMDCWYKSPQIWWNSTASERCKNAQFHLQSRANASTTWLQGFLGKIGEQCRVDCWQWNNEAATFTAGIHSWRCTASQKQRLGFGSDQCRKCQGWCTILKSLLCSYCLLKTGLESNWPSAPALLSDFASIPRD